MTWKKLLAERRVAKEPSDRDEITKLRDLARRNLKDAAVEALSDDGRFDCAYAAARALTTMVVRASGYRVRSPAAHYNTFLALEAADARTFSEFAVYFDTCRGIRNVISYDEPHVVSETELAELLDRVNVFAGVVKAWLAAKHPDVYGP